MKTLLFFLLIAVPTLAQQLPEAPAKVIDKKFVAVMGIEALAKSADMLTTAKHMNQIIGVTAAPGCQLHYPDSCYQWNRFREHNPIFGSNPSAGRLIAENAGIFAGETLLTYELKKHHVKFWWAPALYFASNHTHLAIANTRY